MFWPPSRRDDVKIETANPLFLGATSGFVTPIYIAIDGSQGAASVDESVRGIHNPFASIIAEALTRNPSSKKYVSPALSDRAGLETALFRIVDLPLLELNPQGDVVPAPRFHLLKTKINRDIKTLNRGGLRVLSPSTLIALNREPMGCPMTGPDEVWPSTFGHTPDVFLLATTRGIALGTLAWSSRKLGWGRNVLSLETLAKFISDYLDAIAFEYDFFIDVPSDSNHDFICWNGDAAYSGEFLIELEGWLNRARSSQDRFLLARSSMTSLLGDNKYVNFTVERPGLGPLVQIRRGGRSIVLTIDNMSYIFGSEGCLIYKELGSGEQRQSWVTKAGLFVLHLFYQVQWDQTLLTKHMVTLTRLVGEGGVVAGVGLPRIPASYYFGMLLENRSTRPTLLEFQYVMAPESRKPARGIPSVTPKELLQVILDIVDVPHHNTMVIEDYNPKNILARHSTNHAGCPEGTFMRILLGVDNSRIAGEMPRLQQGQIPNWFSLDTVVAAELRDPLITQRAPELATIRARAASSIQTAKSDIYKIGLLAIRLLHVPEDPERGDAQCSFYSETAEANVNRLVGAPRAALLVGMLALDPTQRPFAVNLLFDFTRGIA
jgi:hypothetical protein